MLALETTTCVVETADDDVRNGVVVATASTVVATNETQAFGNAIGKETVTEG